MKQKEWIEVTAKVPIAVQGLTIDWLISHGATGVQEEYPGLWGGGPIVSGAPDEWGGDAPENVCHEVVLKAYFDEVAEIEDALRGYLSALGIEGFEVHIATRLEEDYLKKWKDSWAPIEVGKKVLVCPSWHIPQPVTERVVVRIDPGMAFGTGTHFTTAACIELLEEALDERADEESITVLDVGTGSGILAITALKLGAHSALCLDVDPDAIEACTKNALLNGVTERMEIRHGTISSSDGVFDVVLANILASTLIEHARPLANAIGNDGVLIISGVTVDQTGQVESAFMRQGLFKWREKRGDGWVATSWRPLTTGL